MKIKDLSESLAHKIMIASKSGKTDQNSRCFKEMARSIAGMFIMKDYDEIRSAAFVNDRLAGKLFDPGFLEKAGKMKLHDMWVDHRELGLDAIFSSAPGLGTPNAAAGAGELFLLLSSQSVEKPSKGDISFLNHAGLLEKVELKAGGKIGSNVQYKDVNQRVIDVCKNLGIADLLPRIELSKKNIGKMQFIPCSSDCQEFLKKISPAYRQKVWQAWWESQDLSEPFSKFENYTWNEIMWSWMRSVMQHEFASTGITAFLIIKNDGNFLVWRTADDALNYYKSNNISPRFEFRAAQSNKPTFYVP